MKTTIAFLAFFLVSCGGNPSENQAALTKAKIGEKAPLFSLQSTDGKSFKLEDYKGKVVLLDFWATWCGPCRYSTPAVVRLNEKMKGKKFQVLSISVDENHADVPPFLKNENVTYPTLYADPEVAYRYRVNSIPQFVIIDKNGIISKMYQGFAPSLESEWESQINRLLK